MFLISSTVITSARLTLLESRYSLNYGSLHRSKPYCILPSQWRRVNIPILKGRNESKTKIYEGKHQPYSSQSGIWGLWQNYPALKGFVWPTLPSQLPVAHIASLSGQIHFMTADCLPGKSQLSFKVEHLQHCRVPTAPWLLHLHNFMKQPLKSSL